MKLTVRPGRPTTLLKAVALLLLLITAGSVVRFAHATPTSIIDTTPGTAIVDGTIDPAEYSGSTEGINSGGSRTIGEDAYLYIDSGGPQEQVVFALEPRAQLTELVVIYIDSIAGGLADTTELADLSDFYTMAVSGANQYGSAHLHFAPDFTADYAIVFNAQAARLYQLVEGLPDTITIAGPVNLLPLDNNSAGQYELGIAMSDIGVTHGDSFKYLATLTGPHIADFYRFNEFNGVSQATYDANSAELQTDFHLASGDYHTFTTMSPTAVGTLSRTATLLSGSGSFLALFLVVVLLATCLLYVVRRRSRQRPI